MIKLKDVSLSFPIKNAHALSFQRALYSNVGGIIGKKPHNTLTYVKALDDISLTIDDGVRLAVLGHNGAGKTTLLRLISGVYPVSSGVVEVRGKVNALTDMSLGMEAEESGRKNIIFRLIFMGYDFKTARAVLDEIIEFSGLGEFIDMPVRTYSTGMYLRLAFSIATQFPPDILVLDEIIGAGDKEFQKKALERIDQLLNSARIVIFSSHDLEAVRKYCNRAIVLNKGKIIQDGSVDDVLRNYQETDTDIVTNEFETRPL